MRWTTTLGTIAGVIATLAVAALAAWNGPDTIGVGGGVAFGSPHMAQADSGWSAAAWVEGGHVHAARYDGTAWRPSAQLDGGAPGSPSEPRVAIGEDGTATVVWLAGGGVWTSMHGADGWTVAERLDALGAVGPSVGAGPDGNAVAGWVEDGIYTVRIRTGGVWWSSESMSGGELMGSGADSGWVTMDESGHAVAVWSEYDGTNYRMFGSRFAQAQWGPAQPIDFDPVFESWAPHVAMDGLGNAAAVWVHNPGGAWRAKSAFYHDGAWHAGGLIDLPPGDGYMDVFFPHVALAPGGLACASYDKIVQGSGPTVMVSLANAYDWTGVVLPESGGESHGSSPAVDAGGGAHVVYETSAGVRAVRFEPSGMVGPEPLGSGTTSDGWCAAGPAGTAMAVFQQDGALVASSFGEAGPPPDPATFPQIRKVKAKSGAAGTVIVFRGKNFGKGEGTVRFGDHTAQVRRWKKNQVQAFIPPGFGEVSVRLTTEDGRFADLPFAYTMPALKKITPKRGQFAGRTVKLKGRSFGAPSEGCSVWFGDLEIPFDDPRILKWKDRLVKVRVPDGDGTVDLRVETPAGLGDVRPFSWR